MKKFFASILIAWLAIGSFGAATLAQADESLTLLESLDNIQKLKSYAIQTSFTGSGSAQSNDGTKAGSGQFTMASKSEVVNRAAYDSDTKTQLNLSAHVELSGPDRPFNTLDATARISMIGLGKKGSYIRIENVSVDANGLPQEDLQSYLDFKTELDKQMESVKWKWIQIPSKTLDSEGSLMAELGGMDMKTLKKELKRAGFKKTIQKALKKQISDMKKEGSLTADEAAKLNSLVNRFFVTQFFDKTTTSGGVVDFILNNDKIMGFIKEVADATEETISGDDWSDIETALSKFKLSGSYHENAEFGIFDMIRAQINVKDVEELENVEFKFVSKIGRVNEIKPIGKPSKFIPLSETEIGSVVNP